MIKYFGFKGDFTHENSALLPYIKKFLDDLSKKKKLPNINLFSNDYFNRESGELKNSINLCITGENIYYPVLRTYRSTKFDRYNSYLIKKFNISLEKLFYCILYSFNSKNQEKITYLRPSLTYFIEKLCKKKSNNFAIITNDFKSENILNFPYFFQTHLDKFNSFIDIKKKSLYKRKENFCAFIVGDSGPKDRIEFFHKLSKYKKVDSYGPVLNNTKVSKELIKKYKNKDINLEEALITSHYSHVTNSYLLNQELFRDYKFVICFENSYANDYITEKLPNVMMANSIGIYRGAKNINEFFNTKSFINYDDYASYDAMIQKIIELDKDDKKYQKMLDEPFFSNNELPLRVKNAKQDLENFLLKVVEQS